MVTPDDSLRSASAVRLAQELRAFSSKLKRRLREQADVGDLTPSQTAVLLRLESGGPATSSSLARCEAMRPQSMGAVVAALEAAGLVAGASKGARSGGWPPNASVPDRSVPKLDRGRPRRSAGLAVENH